MKNETLRSMLVALLALSLTACQSAANHADTNKSKMSDVAAEDEVVGTEAWDPLESVNRGIFHFNYAVDRAVLRPAAMAYKYVVPEQLRTNAHNFIDNLFLPISAANSLLQGNFTEFANTTWRFVINSSLGFFGIADVASEAGLRANDEEDLGQTFAVWGVGSGPYIVLPILGPSNARDMTGRLGEWIVDPYNIVFDDRGDWARGLARGLDSRTNLDKVIEDIYTNSVDPYAAMRSFYHQRRVSDIAR